MTEILPKMPMGESIYIPYALPEFYTRVESTDQSEASLHSAVAQMLWEISGDIIRSYITTHSEAGDPDTPYEFGGELPLVVRVDEGSAKGRSILTTGLLWFALSYGGMRSTIDYVRSDVSWLLNEFKTTITRKVESNSQYRILNCQLRMGSATLLLSAAFEYQNGRIGVTEFEQECQKHISRLKRMHGWQSYYDQLREYTANTIGSVTIWEQIKRISDAIPEPKPQVPLVARLFDNVLAPPPKRDLLGSDESKGEGE